MYGAFSVPYFYKMWGLKIDFLFIYINPYLLKIDNFYKCSATYMGWTKIKY